MQFCSVLANQLDKGNVRIVTTRKVYVPFVCVCVLSRDPLPHRQPPHTPPPLFLSFMPSPLLNLSLPSGLHFYSSHVDHTVSDSG